MEPNEGLNSRTSLALQSRVSDPNSHVHWWGWGNQMLRAALGTREAQMSPTGFPEGTASGGAGTRSVPQLRTAGGDRGGGRSVPEKLDHSSSLGQRDLGATNTQTIGTRGSCDHRGFSLSRSFAFFSKTFAEFSAGEGELAAPFASFPGSWAWEGAEIWGDWGPAPESRRKRAEPASCGAPSRGAPRTDVRPRRA